MGTRGWFAGYDEPRWSRLLRGWGYALTTVGFLGLVVLFFRLPLPRGHGERPFPAWTYVTGLAAFITLALGIVLTLIAALQRRRNRSR